MHRDEECGSYHERTSHGSKPRRRYLDVPDDAVRRRLELQLPVHEGDSSEYWEGEQENHRMPFVGSSLRRTGPLRCHFHGSELSKRSPPYALWTKDGRGRDGHRTRPSDKIGVIRGGSHRLERAPALTLLGLIRGAAARRDV